MNDLQKSVPKIQTKYSLSSSSFAIINIVHLVIHIYNRKWDLSVRYYFWKYLMHHIDYMRSSVIIDRCILSCCNTFLSFKPTQIQWFCACCYWGGVFFFAYILLTELHTKISSNNELGCRYSSIDQFCWLRNGRSFVWEIREKWWLLSGMVK